MTNACRCGRPKLSTSDLSCLRCWERLPPAIRANYIDKSTNKPGAPSYHAALREVLRELVEAAKP